jgi:hypothetical protein
MSKQQIIEAILVENRSAAPEFLVRFDERQLRSYLQRLTLIRGHRGRQSVWVREGDTAAVVTKVA